MCDEHPPPPIVSPVEWPATHVLCPSLATQLRKNNKPLEEDFRIMKGQFTESEWRDIRACGPEEVWTDMLP